MGRIEKGGYLLNYNHSIFDSNIVQKEKMKTRKRFHTPNSSFRMDTHQVSEDIQ